MTIYNENLAEHIATPQCTETTNKAQSEESAMNDTGGKNIDCKPEPTNWNTYKPHPISSIFPKMEGGDFQELKESIRVHGQREAIWIYEEQILDGCNRYTACLELDIEPKFKQYEGNGSVVDFVIDLNLQRRHLNASQKAFIAVEAMPHLEKEARERQLTGKGFDGSGGRGKKKNLVAEMPPGKSREQAAKLVQTGARYITDAKKIQSEAPELAKQVKAGELSIPGAIREIKQRTIAAHSEATEKNQINNTTDVYDVVVVDPSQAAMSIEEIEKRNIPAADNCHLFLWTTQKSLPHALDVLKTWGFKYVCEFVWHKPSEVQSSNSPQHNHETCLYARKGMPEFINTNDFMTCFEAPANNDGGKPDHFYEMVARATTGQRLDMFSSKNIEGFNCGGYEVSNNAIARAA